MANLEDAQRKIAAVREVYLLVIRETKDGAVIAHPDYPDKRCVLFTDDPATFAALNEGQFTNSFFEALPFPPAKGAELMRQAVTDGLTPLFARLENGEVVVGFIGDVRLQKLEVV